MVLECNLKVLLALEHHVLSSRTFILGPKCCELFLSNLVAYGLKWRLGVGLTFHWYDLGWKFWHLCWVSNAKYCWVVYLVCVHKFLNESRAPHWEFSTLENKLMCISQCITPLTFTFTSLLSLSQWLVVLVSVFAKLVSQSWRFDVLATTVAGLLSRSRRPRRLILCIRSQGVVVAMP